MGTEELISAERIPEYIDIFNDNGNIWINELLYENIEIFDQKEIQNKYALITRVFDSSIIKESQYINLLKFVLQDMLKNCPCFSHISQVLANIQIFFHPQDSIVESIINIKIRN